MNAPDTPPLLTIDTFLAYRASTVKRPDESLGLQFTIPVHADLLPVLAKPRRHINCEARIRKGLAWGGLGRGAEVRLTGYVRRGPRGGEYFHCQSLEILRPVPRTPPKTRVPKRVKEVEF